MSESPTTEQPEPAPRIEQPEPLASSHESRDDPPSTLANSAPAAALATADPWQQLRRFTPARIALGRVGASLPTAEVLALSMAHARARDAVHLPLDVASIKQSLEQAGFSVLEVHSQAGDRSEYLRRPDLGRRLHPASVSVLRPETPPPQQRLSVVVADGLSSLAPMRHALPVLLELRARLSFFDQDKAAAWSLDNVVLATQARVGLSDAIGELRGAEAVVILLGERPGLSSPDSLGIYMTYAPRPGRSDAERNCISNVRAGGLSYSEAAYKLHYLLNQARNEGASGIAVKDASDWQTPAHGLTP